MSADGGNIEIAVGENLVLRENSQISATAGTAAAGGDGGNITISAPLIIAVPQENSDITANAFLGNGGNISITADAIFGLDVRNQLTILSDITASSELGLEGNININTAGIDPVRGLANLPLKVVNTEIRVACQPGGRKNTSSFKFSSSGGLPTNPQESFEMESFIDRGEIDNFIQEWDSLKDSSESDQSHLFFNNSSEVIKIDREKVSFWKKFPCDLPQSPRSTGDKPHSELRLPRSAGNDITQK